MQRGGQVSDVERMQELSAGLEFDDDGNAVKPYHRSKILRETVLTQQMITTIGAALAGNQSMAVAAGLVGVTVGTLNEWIRKGNLPDADDIYVKLAKEVRTALAEGEGGLVQVLNRRALNGSAADAKFLLERRHGDSGWRRAEEKQAGEGGNVMVIQLSFRNTNPQDIEALEAAEDEDIVDAEVVE